MQSYWNDPAIIQREAARIGNLSLAERLAWRDVLRRYGKLGQRRLKVLDIGTRTGLMAMLAAEMKASVVAIDPHESLLSVGRQYALEQDWSCQFVQSALDEVNFEDNAFDVVIAYVVLERLENPDKAFAEWLRVLKANGLLLLITNEAENRRAYERWWLFETQSRPDFFKWMQKQPLYGMDSAEIVKQLTTAGANLLLNTRLAGQLIRQALWHLRSIEIAYNLIVVEKEGDASIPLTISK